jgi:cytochrome c biogenesis protein CcdA
MSNDSYYRIELISGIVMTLVGIWYYRKKRHAPPSRSQNIIVARLKSISGMTAFCIGAFISATSFPFSIPYIIALEKYTTLQLNFSAVVGSILLYNIGYALPMLVIFVLYLVVRKGKDNLSDTLPEKTRVLNVHLTTWVLVGVGIFSIMDAGCYYTIGHALVKGRYF